MLCHKDISVQITESTLGWFPYQCRMTKMHKTMLSSCFKWPPTVDWIPQPHCLKSWAPPYAFTCTCICLSKLVSAAMMTINWLATVATRAKLCSSLHCVQAVKHTSGGNPHWLWNLGISHQKSKTVKIVALQKDLCLPEFWNFFSKTMQQELVYLTNLQLEVDVR